MGVFHFVKPGLNLMMTDEVAVFIELVIKDINSIFAKEKLNLCVKEIQNFNQYIF